MSRKHDIVVPTNKSGGVYMLYNLSNHKVYIGESGNLRRRAAEHKKQLESKLHSNKALQADYDSGDEFSFVILERCSAECGSFERMIKERQYMWVFLDSSIQLYNKEDKTHLEELLFSDMVRPTLWDVKKRCRKQLGAPLASLRYRNTLLCYNTFRLWRGSSTDKKKKVYHFAPNT